MAQPHDLDMSKIPTKDLELIVSGDMSKVSTETLEYLAGSTGKEADAAPQGGGDGAPPSPDSASQVPTPPEEPWWKSAGKGAIRGAAKTLPYVGMMGGALLGTGATPGPGTIAGAGLGFAGGKQAENFIESQLGDRKWQGWGREVPQTFMDIAEGATGEMGGQVLSKGVGAVGKALAPHAEGLYGKAIQTPITGKWKTWYLGEEGNAREAAVRAGLEGEIPPNKLGLRMAQQKAKSLTDYITEIVKKATGAHAEGAPWSGRWMKDGGKTPVGKFVDEGLRGARADAFASGDSKVANDAVKVVEENVRRMGGVKSELNPEQLLNLKRQFDAEIAWDKSNPIINIKGQFTQNAKMGLRDAAMKRLEEMIPELGSLNKDTSAYIDLKEAIEHTIARKMNKPTVDFSSKVLALKDLTMATLNETLGSSAVRAKLAFAIKKGAKWRARNAARMGAVSGVEGARDRTHYIDIFPNSDKGNPNPGGEGGDTVIRYNAEGVRQ